MRNTFRNILIIAFLFFCVLGEILAAEYFFNIGEKEKASIFYFIFGLIIAIVPLFFRIDIKNSFVRVSKYLFLLLLLGAMAYSMPIFIDLFERIPISLDYADMLPIIDVMCEKSLSGVSPYTPIEEIWDGVTSRYLPLMWMPYLIGKIFGFDLRWVGIFLLLASLLFFFIRQDSSRFSIWSFLTLVPLGALFYLIFTFDENIFAATQESCIVAYYLFLAWAIHKNSKSGIILGLVACLLSRYTLLFWAIMYFIHYLGKNKKEALEIAWKVGLIAIIIMSISTAIFHLDLFLGKTTNILADAQNPIVKWRTLQWIDSGLGMARFFEYENLSTLHYIFIFFNIAVPAFSLWIYSKFKNYMNISFFGICSLKIALVFFFNLIIMPVKYIFITSSFLSVLILFFFLNQINDKEASGQKLSSSIY